MLYKNRVIERSQKGTVVVVRIIFDEMEAFRKLEACLNCNNNPQMLLHDVRDYESTKWSNHFWKLSGTFDADRFVTNESMNEFHSGNRLRKKKPVQKY
jgi:nitrate reductase cytochrome c-type subunit